MQVLPILIVVALSIGNQPRLSPGKKDSAANQRSSSTKNRDLERVEADCYHESLNSLALKLPLVTYPPEAVRKKIGGKVTVKVFVDEQGDVYYAISVAGPPVLRKAALRSARKAKFKPFMRNDSPIKCAGNLIYTFNAPK